MIVQHAHHWKYTNIALLGVSFVVAYVLSQSPQFHDAIVGLGSWGYLGAFVGGMLFVSTFTVAPGTVILLVLTKTMSPITLGLVAGLGAVVSNLFMFRFIHHEMSTELRPIFKRFRGSHLAHLLHTRYFHWTLPVLGALIIASPFPDELGVGLLGISDIAVYEFVLLSFFLNSLGIFLLVSGWSLLGA